MTLHLENLPDYMDERQVEALFNRVGGVKKITLHLHHKTKQPTGIATVEMEDEAAARKAIDYLDGTEMERLPLIVELG